MTSRISGIAIDALDPDALAAFWCGVLGWRVTDRDEGITSIGPPDEDPAPGPTIDLLRVAEPKAVKDRLHLDLRADGTTTEAELARLLALGARRADVGQPPDATWTVLADPEGNEFCLLGRSVEEEQQA